MWKIQRMNLCQSNYLDESAASEWIQFCHFDFDDVNHLIKGNSLTSADWEKFLSCKSSIDCEEDLKIFEVTRDAI